MGMPLEMNWMIVTKSNEVKLEGNCYELNKDGYRMYPMEIPIEVKKQKIGAAVGFAKIKSVTWSEGSTKIIYELIKLKTEA